LLFDTPVIGAEVYRSLFIVDGTIFLVFFTKRKDHIGLLYPTSNTLFFKKCFGYGVFRERFFKRIG